MDSIDSRRSDSCAQNRALHSKARREKPAEYPDRFPVPDEKVSWQCEFPDYRPPYYVSPVVCANDCTRNPNGWADPEEITLLPSAPRESFEGVLVHDRAGRPLNPLGRTGISGRGLLGKWGPNYAADPIITRFNKSSGMLEMLAIQRKDNGQWAIPGGMVDKGEEVSRTLSRELQEETGVTLAMDQGRMIYRGYVDDPRNTDHAWMETTAKHLHLSDEIADRMNLLAGDDARAVRWLPLLPENMQELYASHCALIIKTLTEMVRDNFFDLSADEISTIATLVHSIDEN
ncbi:MAG: NUDIX domain-containing protein [Deltaproteobacteria bacterium]|nr:NUDIX domain-containing protein [Deltaproteobacteria bacterium]TLN03634.1 MAG: NUDIX domain-containing protein [bacterium]